MCLFEGGSVCFLSPTLWGWEGELWKSASWWYRHTIWHLGMVVPYTWFSSRFQNKHLDLESTWDTPFRYWRVLSHSHCTSRTSHFLVVYEMGVKNNVSSDFFMSQSPIIVFVLQMIYVHKSKRFTAKTTPTIQLVVCREACTHVARMYSLQRVLWTKTVVCTVGYFFRKWWLFWIHGVVDFNSDLSRDF